jgi:glutathione S-transferase
MRYELLYHPFASYCMKVLVALYELDVAFDGTIVDLGDPEQRAALDALWPMGKFPVLRDRERDRVVVESSIVIEYLVQQHRGPQTLLPADGTAALAVRMLDRFHDIYVHMPMQAIVADRLRPREHRDPYGVEQGKASLRRAYDWLERELAGERTAFTLADCSAAPALHYANMVEPFGPTHGRVAAYLDRLYARPSFARVIAEAAPYRDFFPKE